MTVAALMLLLVGLFASSRAANVCECTGGWHGARDDFKVVKYSGGQVQMDTGHSYLATDMTEAGACDHTVHWKTDPRNEFMHDLVLTMKDGTKLKLNLDVVNDELEASVTDMTGGANEALDTTASGYKSFRSSPIKWRYRGEDFEVDVASCGVYFAYSPTSVTIRHPEGSKHGGGLCGSCAEPKKGGQRAGFDLGSFGDSTLAATWQKLSWIRRPIQVPANAVERVKEVCGSLREGAPCAALNIDEICTLAVIHLPRKQYEQVIVTALKVFRDRCGRAAGSSPSFAVQRCIITRGEANRLTLRTFDNMVLDLTPRATYLVTKRVNTESCDHSISVTIAASRETPVVIKFVEFTRASGGVLRIEPKLYRAPNVYVNPGGENRKLDLSQGSLRVEEVGLHIKMDNGYFVLDAGACDVMLRTNGVRVYTKTSEPIPPNELDGACGNGDGNPAEPMPADMLTTDYVNNELRQHIYNLAWQLKKKYPLGSETSNIFADKVCNDYENNRNPDNPLIDIVKTLTPEVRAHFRKTCTTLVNQFYDYNQVTMYRHICSQFRTFQKAFDKDNKLELPEHCKPCTCTAKNIGGSQTRYWLFDGADQTLTYKGRCPQLLTERMKADDRCYFRVEMDVREKDGASAITEVRVALGNPVKHILFPRDRGVRKVGLFNIKQFPGNVMEARSSECGVKITWKPEINRINVRLAPGYGDGTQGICGTCNGKEDDVKTSSGDDVSGFMPELASSAVVDSYQVGEWIKTEVDGKFKYILKTQYVHHSGQAPKDSCIARDERFEHCSPTDVWEVLTERYCGTLVMDKNGPFSECLAKNAKLRDGAKTRFNDCRKAVCGGRYGRTSKACRFKQDMAKECGFELKDSKCQT